MTERRSKTDRGSEKKKLREHLQKAGLRPTRPRMALAEILWAAGDRHVTPEQLYQEAKMAGIPIALGTVYNNLHQFTQAGMLRELVLDHGKHYFDTNIQDHHHFYDPDRGMLTDIPFSILPEKAFPELPKGMKVERVDVIIHLQKK